MGAGEFADLVMGLRGFGMLVEGFFVVEVFEAKVLKRRPGLEVEGGGFPDFGGEGGGDGYGGGGEGGGGGGEGCKRDDRGDGVGDGVGGASFFRRNRRR